LTLRRVLALFVVAYTTWVLLTWTMTKEQLLVGAACSIVVAIACAPLGEVAAPWKALDPRRFVRLIATAGWALGRIVAANVELSRRIWSPRRPIRPGMVTVPTTMESDGELTAVGLVTSLIVDNQLVDVDRRRHQLLYHTVWVDSEDPEENRRHINGPVEDRVGAISRP
jgi:multicomponent Na+:H+ antiporter subunit E